MDAYARVAFLREQGARTTVLMQQLASGVYVLPGGLVLESDKHFRSTILRELKEGTWITDDAKEKIGRLLKEADTVHIEMDGGGPEELYIVPWEPSFKKIEVPNPDRPDIVRSYWVLLTKAGQLQREGIIRQHTARQMHMLFGRIIEKETTKLQAAPT